ncbi:MAG: hypothetical protein WBC21_04050 [Minisyncoccales bacterium]
MGIFLQIIGIILAILGFILHSEILFIIGGFILLFLDIIGMLSGKLNPIMPIFLYIGGYIVVGDWTGILWGAVIGNFIDTVFFLGALGIGEGISAIKDKFKKTS